MASKIRRVKSYDHFYSINERPVDEISLEFFYRPHTITLLSLSILGLLYLAFTRSDDHTEANISAGLSCVVFFFLIISVLAFPNGPFTRPHPAIWRIVFGLSVLYFMLLVFILFQRLDDVKEMLFWVYPEQRHFKLQEKVYAVNCSSVSVRRLWNELDVFAFGHFWGWVMKALLVRHYGICWTISVTWEMTEMAFAHLLPNFAECWWDMLILDVLLCNGLGIWVGMVICNLMEMRNYHWESIKDIHSTTGKIRRAVLQFTPASWTHVRWLDPHSSYMRVVAISVLVVVWNLSELNNFFLMEYFGHEPGDLPTLTHLFIVWLLSGPAIRQYYSYVTDTQCKRVGTQCWVFCAIIFTESLICLKFGLQIFKQTQIMYIVMWLTIQMVSCLLCVYLCAYIAKRSTQSDDIQDDFASEGTTTEEVISRPVTVPNGRTLLHQYNYKDNSFSLHATETTETTATTSDRHPLLLGHMTNGAALQYDQVSDGLTTTATENNRYNLRKRGRDGL